MRAVAVILVVAFHAGWRLFSGGFVGVDVFFVLSGFLITGLLAGELNRSGKVSFAKFYGRRARRLLPMSTVVLVVTAIAFSFVLSPLDRGTLASDIKAAALYVANWHFAAGSLDYMNDPNRSPVLHYWSLAVEEQFYIVWPILLVLVARRRRVGRHVRGGANRRMLVALAVLAAVSLLLSAVLTRTSEPFSYYGLHTRAWELAAGGLLSLSLGWVRSWPQAARGLAGWLGLLLVVGSSVMMGPDTVFPGIAATVPVAGTVLLVAAGASGSHAGVSRLLSAAPLTYVGRMSYAWYLWHWPCLIFVGTLAGPTATGDDSVGSVLPHGWAALAAVVVSFGLSVASHEWLEDPVRRSQWLAAVRHRSLALGAALTTTVIGAVGVVLPVASATAAPHPVVVDVEGGPSPAAATNHVASRSVERKITLRMSPTAARNDDPGNAGGCYGDYESTTASPGCVFGDPHGRVRVALVGDSHAQQWFPALHRIALNRHWQLWVWTKAACPLVDLPVHLARFEGRYPACTQWRTSVLSRLAALPRFDAVVVSNFGGLAKQMSDTDGHLLKPRDVGAAWQAAWARTLGRLRPLTRRVIVLRDVPTPSTDVPACVASHTKDVRPCSFRRDTAFKFSNLLYNAERAVPSPVSRYVDMTDLLCPGDRCPVVWSDGSIIYRDSHHLTATVSLDLAPYLGPRLVRAMKD